MNSLVMEICQKVRRTLEQLYSSIDSPECSDKEIDNAIDNAIEDIRENIKPINSSNSGKLSWHFQILVINPLKEAKKEAKLVLKLKETGDYKKLIWNAHEGVDLIRDQIPQYPLCT